jgi:hypothetical protein
MHEDEFNDPSGWDSASYTDDPIDRLEPPEPSEPSPYREASLLFLRILSVIDAFMVGSYDSRKGWLQVSCALGLQSTRGCTESEIASSINTSKQVFSRGVTAFLRSSGLSPAFGLKSNDARKNYQKTNYSRKLNGKVNGHGSYLTLLHGLFSEKAIEQLQTDDFSTWNETELQLAIVVLEPLVRVRNRMLEALAIE